MSSTKENLDKRICDVHEFAQNTETFREFIRNSEEFFGMHPREIDSMSEEDLNGYINFLDYLWDK